MKHKKNWHQHHKLIIISSILAVCTCGSLSNYIYYQAVTSPNSSIFGHPTSSVPDYVIVPEVTPAKKPSDDDDYVPHGQSKAMYQLNKDYPSFKPPKLAKTKLHDFNIASSINTLTLAKNAQNHIYSCPNLVFVKSKNKKPKLVHLLPTDNSNLVNSTQNLNAYAKYSFLVPRNTGYVKQPHFRFKYNQGSWLKDDKQSDQSVLTPINSKEFKQYQVPQQNKLSVGQIYQENSILPGLYGKNTYSILSKISNNYFNALANCDTRFWASDFTDGFSTSLVGQNSSFRINTSDANMYLFNNRNKMVQEIPSWCDGNKGYDAGDAGVDDYIGISKKGYYVLENYKYKNLNDIDWRKHHYVKISDQRYLSNNTVYQLLALPYYWPKNDFADFKVLEKGHTPSEQEIKVNGQYYYGDILCHYIPGQYIKKVNNKAVIANKNGKLFYKESHKPVATIQQNWWDKLLCQIREKINR